MDSTESRWKEDGLILPAEVLLQFIHQEDGEFTFFSLMNQINSNNQLLTESCNFLLHHWRPEMKHESQHMLHELDASISCQQKQPVALNSAFHQTKQTGGGGGGPLLLALKLR